jgi:hypothetical protein
LIGAAFFFSGDVFLFFLSGGRVFFPVPAFPAALPAGGVADPVFLAVPAFPAALPAGGVAVPVFFPVSAVPASLPAGGVADEPPASPCRVAASRPPVGRAVAVGENKRFDTTEPCLRKEGSETVGAETVAKCILMKPITQSSEAW